MVCCVCVPRYSVVFDSVMPQTVGRHAPLFMEFPRQGYWSGLSFPTPRHLPNPGTKPASLASHWQADSLLPHQLGMKAHPRSYLQKNLHCSPMSGRVAFLLAGVGVGGGGGGEVEISHLGRAEPCVKSADPQAASHSPCSTLDHAAVRGSGPSNGSGRTPRLPEQSKRQSHLEMPTKPPQCLAGLRGTGVISQRLCLPGHVCDPGSGLDAMCR